MCVCVCVVSVIVKRPVLPPSAVDGRSRNPLYYLMNFAFSLFEFYLLPLNFTSDLFECYDLSL